MDQKDRIAGLFWLAVSAMVIFKAIELDVGSFSNPGSGFVLSGAGMLFALLSIALIIKSFLGRGQGKSTSGSAKSGSMLNVLITFSALIFYVVFFRRAGFVLCAFGLMIVLYIMGKYRPLWAITGALLTVAFSYALFHFALHVPFPRGPFAW